MPSLVPFWYHLVPHHQTLPNLVYKHLKPFWTTFRKGIFWLNKHRKTFISKSADFVIFSDITNKMADASDILYISTALIQSLCGRWSHWNWKNQQTMGRIFHWGINRLWHIWHQFPKGFGSDKKGPFVRCHLPHWLQLFWKVWRWETTKAEQNYWTQINAFEYHDHTIHCYDCVI